MATILEVIKTWSPILVPILGLIAGGGWLQYYLTVRSKRQEKYKTILEDFLIPFDGLLHQTSLAFESLRDDRELVHLEYHPGRLQQFYASLPDDDVRKHLWKAKIAALQKEIAASSEHGQKADGLKKQLDELTKERGEVRNRIAKLVELLEGLD